MKENNKLPRLGSIYRLTVAILCIMAALFPFIIHSPSGLPDFVVPPKPQPFHRYPIQKSKSWSKTVHTLDNFQVAGVNLAVYGQKNDANTIEKDAWPYELYEDFDIGDKIQGDEGWWDLVHYHRDLQRPSLTFYMDKVAQKRWFKAIGIPCPKSYAIKYGSELDAKNRTEERKAILQLLPKRANYAAKPTHMSCSSGVWLVKFDEDSKETHVGQGHHRLELIKDKKKYRRKIAKSLSADLHDTAESDESWALLHARPGILIEERFTAWDTDTRPAVEFKLITIWGRVWLANWKRGSHRPGLVHRNGTIVDWKGKGEDALPEWVDWNRVVELAERLGANKDMFRVDIYAGVPAGSPSLREGATRQERMDAVQIVVSETELHPTNRFGDSDPRLFEEAARLWIAGYKIGNYRIVQNKEVPPSFLLDNSFSEANAAAL